MKLEDILSHIKDQKYPPVHLWNPDYCGDMDMVIKRDGSWHYMGSPIGRARMVKLFASILRLDQDDQGNDHYVLVTPVEKIGITVEDVPFVTTEMDIIGHEGQQVIRFITNVGDQVVVDGDHPIEVIYDADTEEPRPYVTVRSGLKARINRQNFYELADHAAERNGAFVITSMGEDFILGASDV